MPGLSEVELDEHATRVTSRAARDGALRVLAPALVVLALVTVVAIAAGGSTPTGSSDSRAPAGILVDSVFSLILLLFAIAAVILVYGLTQREAIAREIAIRRYRRFSFLAFVFFMLIFTALLSWGMQAYEPRPAVDELGEQGFPGEGLPPAPGEDGAVTPYEPSFVWEPIALVLGLAAVAAATWFVVSRRRRARQRRGRDKVAEAIAEVLDDTLDDLRAEKDPRKAVIAAYARLERVLAVHDLGRNEAEAPGEYLARILPRLELERGSVRRLTDLFTRAKFSHHEVDAGMKDEAIDALTTVRDELRAADERRREELTALEAVPERP